MPYQLCKNLKVMPAVRLLTFTKPFPFLVADYHGPLKVVYAGGSMVVNLAIHLPTESCTMHHKWTELFSRNALSDAFDLPNLYLYQKETMRSVYIKPLANETRLN